MSALVEDNPVSIKRCRSRTQLGRLIDSTRIVVRPIALRPIRTGPLQRKCRRQPERQIQAIHKSLQACS